MIRDKPRPCPSGDECNNEFIHVKFTDVCTFILDGDTEKCRRNQMYQGRKDVIAPEMARSVAR